MTITYKDKTFCINQNCTHRCKRFLTLEIEQAAKEYGLPIAVSEFICVNKGEDGVYRIDEDEGCQHTV